MTEKSSESPATRQLEQAAAEVERSKRQLASSLGALQYRLKPGTLMNNAWEGVRDKSGEVADNTLQAVKNRPATVSGIIAAIILFLVREPLWRLIVDLFSGGAEEREDTIQADLDHDENYDLTAPSVTRSRPEGVNA
jgi:hypothetical protein